MGMWGTKIANFSVTQLLNNPKGAFKNYLPNGFPC